MFVLPNEIPPNLTLDPASCSDSPAILWIILGGIVVSIIINSIAVFNQSSRLSGVIRSLELLKAKVEQIHKWLEKEDDSGTKLIYGAIVAQRLLELQRDIERLLNYLEKRRTE